MPVMAGDWPRNSRAYPLPQPTEPPAPVRTLPSVAELLSTSSRPSVNTSVPAYHDYQHAPSTPHWNPVNHHPASPPVSPTEQRPLSTSTSTTSTETTAATATATATATSRATPRVYQEPQFRRQQVPKPDEAIQHSALTSSIHNAPHSSTIQARQDSAIDQHRFEHANDAQLSKSNIPHSHQSSKDGHRQPSVALNPYPSESSASAYAPVRQHSKSLSSGLSYSAASPRSHEHTAERTIPVDIRNNTDSSTNTTGSSSLPESFYGPQFSNGTRQQRYNVRFAANYTSENMPSSQKPRNDPPTPNATSAIIAEPEPRRSSPVLVATTEEPLISTTNGSTHHPEPQTRTTRDSRDSRESRDRGDREPSVERCSGCNEAWRRPIPDLDSRHISPAETNEEFRQIASNMIERLRKQNKMAEAAYDEWKWRHSRCNYRPSSPFSTGSVEDAPRRTEPGSQAEGTNNGTTDRKRKSEVPHEPHSASKQQRVTDTGPVPPVCRLESS
ncbi:hypothetical protein EKO04_009595 [Ascochyta lentis]|uniref:Uncharacterized protein n=1 Tax=Ascochyta lentis TaxID=205686 RepID=A0A8H7IUY0_9PLEO|nr:hypothetical protein EKO04_009595 [Ascochyta lentis]